MNPAAFEEFHCRLDPDTHDDEVAFKTQASFGDDVRHACGSLEGSDGVLEDGAYTLSAVEVRDRPAHRLTKHAEERRCRRVDGHNVQAFLPKGRRHFRADEPHTHNDDSATGHHLVPNAIGILDRAKPVNPIEIAAGNRDAPIAPARGDEEGVKRNAMMILELDESV